MVALFESLAKIRKKKVLVVGDLVVDAYTIGHAKRISPEAPVAVLDVQKEERKPGMAANVALNLISLGTEVKLLGRVGCDARGKELVQNLGGEGVDIADIVQQAGYPTAVKNRIIASNQQIVRVDTEDASLLPQSLQEKCLEKLPAIVEEVALVAISDYGKGFLTDTFLAAIIDQSKKAGIPVVVDPKGINFKKYRGASMIKPNCSELYQAANLSAEAPLEQAAAVVLQQTQAEWLMVTRSEKGISLFAKDGEREDFPVEVHEVRDVTGAGDTVLAVLAFCLSNGLTTQEAAQLSNIAAGIAIERFGCARVSFSEIARKLKC